MTAISATGVRSNFSEVLGRVAYGKERVVIERRGRPLAVMVPIDDLERLEIDATGGHLTAEGLRRPLGKNLPGPAYRRSQHMIKFPIRDEADRFTGLGTIASDVADRNTADELLRRGKAEFDLITNNILVLISFIDNNARFRFANKGYEEWYGLPQHRIVGRHMREVFGEERYRALQGRVAKVLNGERVRYEDAVTFSNGLERYLAVEFIPLTDRDGLTDGFISLTHDITERKRAEASRQRAREDLERRVEERTRELHAANRALEAEVGTRKKVEARLRESERDLLNLVEGSIQGVLIISKERKPRFVNRACAEIFGYDSPADILSLENTLALVDPSEFERIDTNNAKQFSQDEAPDSYELDGIRKDGSTVRLQCMIRTVDWKGERVAQITLYDITERRKAERAQRESEERLRQATELAGLGHCIWDSLEDRCLFCSEEYARIHGLTPEEYIARATTSNGEFNHPDDRDAYRTAIMALRQGDPFEMEYRVVAPDGEIKHVREIAKPIFDETGAVTGEICTIQDITGHKRTEEMVRTRDSWLRAILENAPVQIVIKDTEGRIMAISRNTAEMLGAAMDEFPGRTTADFLPEEIAKIYMATDREVVATGRPIQQEVAEDWDGTTRYFLSSKFPLRDDNAQIIGICSLTSDITEEKVAEERLRQAQKMEAVGQLTGGVAHDFNNLLAVILGSAELLSERLGAEDRQVLAVTRAAERGAALTQRLLAFSRHQPLKPRAIDLTVQFAETIEILNRTLGEAIEISVATAPGLWPASADPGHLETALLNLAINARDAMAEGGRLSISSANASLEADEIASLLAGQAPVAAAGEPGGPGDPGDYVVVSVSDTGTGMSPAVLARVFEPFFTTKDVGQGSGLGLSMVYGFARQSGGFAAIESAPGRGTTVRLYLPRAASPAPGIQDRAGQLPQIHGETVLLLEDAWDMRELTLTLLTNLGYRVLAAADAADADVLLAENPGVDLLLSDVILPGGRSGPDFAEIARRHNPTLKVLFMSGYPVEATLGRADSRDRDTPLLLKPFRKATLAKAVRDTLDNGAEGHGTV